MDQISMFDGTVSGAVKKVVAVLLALKTNRGLVINSDVMWCDARAHLGRIELCPVGAQIFYHDLHRQGQITTPIDLVRDKKIKPTDCDLMLTCDAISAGAWNNAVGIMAVELGAKSGHMRRELMEGPRPPRYTKKCHRQWCESMSEIAANLKRCGL